MYSIVPPEVVFKNFYMANDEKLMEVDYMGEKLIVAALSNNRYEIRRIISSSPESFLKPELQPGNVIHGSLNTK